MEQETLHNHIKNQLQEIFNKDKEKDSSNKKITMIEEFTKYFILNNQQFIVKNFGVLTHCKRTLENPYGRYGLDKDEAIAFTFLFGVLNGFKMAHLSSGNYIDKLIGEAIQKQYDIEKEKLPPLHLIKP